MELDSDSLNLDLMKNLRRLEPFGAGNPNPVFAMKNLILKQCNVIGSNQNHLKIFCEDDTKKSYECVYWNQKELNIPAGSRFDIAFYPKINSFNNVTNIQLDIQDIKSESLHREEEPLLKILDHRKKTGIYDQICDYLMTTKLKTAVFSENREISDSLSKYKLIAERICDRVNIPKCSQIMFFDYPSSKPVFNKLCEKSGAKVVHFMNFENKKIDVEDLIKKISGMFKYASNNRGGKIKISEIAAFLGISEEIAELVAGMFESLGMIEIFDKEKDFMVIKFINPVELAKIKELDLYDELCDEVQKIYEFKNGLCRSNLNEFLKPVF
jgi:single-stranded-DNA-specific exonuclease